MPENLNSQQPTSASDLTDLQRATEQAAQSQRTLNAELDLSGRLGQQFGHALTNAFIGIALQGKSLGDVLRGLAASLSRLALNAAFKPLENALGGALQAGLGGGFGLSAGGSSVATPFTGSGSIAAPAGFLLTSGSSLSRSEPMAGPAALGGGSVTSVTGNPAATAPVHVTFHVTSPDAESFRRSETQIAAMLARAVGNGNRNL